MFEVKVQRFQLSKRSMAEVSRDTNAQRQRRRKKRISRETDDYANENLESQSSLPERIPLQEVVDGEKSGVQRSASNNSGDQEGSSGVHQSTVERRSRPRRPRRRSRLENGKVVKLFAIRVQTNVDPLPSIRVCLF